MTRIFVLRGRQVENGYRMLCPFCGMDRITPHAEEKHYCGITQTGSTLRTAPTAAPSVFIRATNFAASAARHLAAGMPRATEKQVAERFAICQTCEHFDGKACRQCGCPVVRARQYVSKLSWADSECPVGKWGPVSS